MVHKLLHLTFVVLSGFAVVAAGQEPKRAALENRPLIIGHRGLLHGAPENTLAGFRACLALRFGFEFDVRRTKDGQLVCLHDETLERTTNGKGRLAELSVGEVRRLDAGSRFDVAFRGEAVPAVEEILALVGQQSSDSSLIAVDLKDAGGGIEEAIVRLAEKYDVLGRLVFIGQTIESPEIRARLRGANPRVQLARLAATPDNVEEVLADKHADWVYVRFLPQTEQVRRIHEQGKRLFLAGPLVAGNEPGNWSKAADLEFDAVLTDYPIDMQRQLRRAAP
jgi:glycerophosphoryl diester phosphodiesterase